MKSLVAGCSAIVVTGCFHDAPPAPTPVVNRAPSMCIADSPTALKVDLPRAKDCTEPTACREACGRGDAAACLVRAMAIERDPATATEAVGLYERACQLGAAIGCTNYGANLWAKADPDRACARRIFDKGCAAREPYACGMVGRMTFEDAAVAADYARARSQLEGTCATLGGFPCRILAIQLETGKLGTYDPDRIKELLKAACDGGDPPACGDHATAAETLND